MNIKDYKNNHAFRILFNWLMENLIYITGKKLFCITIILLLRFFEAATTLAKVFLFLQDFVF
jgi:hypothetical protein